MEWEMGHTWGQQPINIAFSALWFMGCRFFSWSWPTLTIGLIQGRGIGVINGCAAHAATWPLIAEQSTMRLGSCMHSQWSTLSPGSLWLHTNPGLDLMKHKGQSGSSPVTLGTLIYSLTPSKHQPLFLSHCQVLTGKVHSGGGLSVLRSTCTPR